MALWHMLTGLAQVGQGVGVGAAGFFESVGKDEYQVLVDLLSWPKDLGSAFARRTVHGLRLISFSLSLVVPPCYLSSNAAPARCLTHSDFASHCPHRPATPRQQLGVGQERVEGVASHAMNLSDGMANLYGFTNIETQIDNHGNQSRNGLALQPVFGGEAKWLHCAEVWRDI